MCDLFLALAYPFSLVHLLGDGGFPHSLRMFLWLAHFPVRLMRQPGPPLHPQPEHEADCGVCVEVKTGAGGVNISAAEISASLNIVPSQAPR